MKLLAISDLYIPQDIMQVGLASLGEVGIDVTVRQWEHDALTELQEANLAIEQHGPDAVPLPDDLLVDFAGFDFLVVQFAPVARRVIDTASSLRAIAVLRGGTENIDVDVATSRGVAVLNTPGRNARAVAECTLGLMLSEVRNLARGHAAMMQSQWRRDFPNRQEIPELCDKTVGLIGFGAVAQLVAGYLDALGSRVIAFDPFFEGDAGRVQLVDLGTLLETSDVVSLHARLTEASRHVIGRDELHRMKATAVIVNTARSGLIDHDALVEALQSRRITGAALDVFDEEPLPDGHPLLGLDNVTLTPHVAGSTIDAFRNSPKLAAGHLTRMLRGDTNVPIINGVSPRLPELPQ